MPTQASLQALQGLRDLSMLKWYVVPLLAIVAYIYAVEIKKCRESGNWDPILAGATVFGMDFINETWNGWVFHLTQYSAFWTTPGDTALRTMIGWNLEIMFMFSIAGIIFYHSLFPEKEDRVFGIPNRWFWAVFATIFCVFIEVVLNIGGQLVWEYPWWKLSFGGIWLILLIGYFIFFAAVNIMLNFKSMKGKLIFIGSIYAIAIGMNVIGLGILGFVY